MLESVGKFATEACYRNLFELQRGCNFDLSSFANYTKKRSIGHFVNGNMTFPRDRGIIESAVSLPEISLQL